MRSSKKFFITTIVMLLLGLHGCEYSNTSRKEGAVKEYYPNGKLKLVQEYQNNLPNGIYKEYFKNGILGAEGFFKDGLPHGVFKSYYDNGAIQEVMSYKNGLLDGKRVLYYRNGDIQSEEEYLKGKLLDNQGEPYTGVYKLLNQEGGLKEAKNYENGILHGDVIEYYPNGQVYRIESYTDGKITGISKGFYEDGTVAVEAKYSDTGGLLEIKHFDKAGKLIEEKNY